MPAVNETRINTIRKFVVCSGSSRQIPITDEARIFRSAILTSLSRISKQVIENENLPETLSLLLKILKEDMGVTRGMVNLFNRRTGKIFIHESIGLTEKEKSRGVYSLGEGITGKVVESKQFIIVPRISDEPNFLNRTQSHTKSEDSRTAFVCVPILRGEKVLGTISIERCYDDQFLLQYDVEILTIVGAMIVQAVEVYMLEHEERAFWLLKNRKLQDALKEMHNPKSMLGQSKPMLEVYSLIDKISQTNTTVLLLGESGVGKEQVANAIHFNGKDGEKPFVKCNCAALPENLIESELFGHEKGAFTGADVQRKGRFEEADGGTLFLDEIGDLSLPMQVKILRVIQERTFERIGSNKSIQVNIRIIAATNRNLEKMVKEGSFREDLYYRLSVFPIMIPPLRERGSDIILLADHFAAFFSQKLGKRSRRISAAVQKIILTYSWPGNVRELENVMERAVILSEDNVIHSYNLPIFLQSAFAASGNPSIKFESRFDTVEYEMIIEALITHKGNLAAAARELGVTRRTLGIKNEKFKINYRMFRNPDDTSQD